MSKTNPDKCGFASPLSLRSFQLLQLPATAPPPCWIDRRCDDTTAWTLEAHTKPQFLYIWPTIFTNTLSRARTQSQCGWRKIKNKTKKCRAQASHFIRNRTIPTHNTLHTLKSHRKWHSNHRWTSSIYSNAVFWANAISWPPNKIYISPNFFLLGRVFCWFNQNENQTSLAQFIMLRHIHAPSHFPVLTIYTTAKLQRLKFY